jgi:hypothetical protein
MKKTLIIPTISVLAGAALLEAQFGGIVFDPTQNANALRQIAQEVQELAKIDQYILTLTAELKQIQTNATFFSANIKRGWIGTGNMIVRNWTVPNYYGETALWQNAINLASGNLQAWQQATIAMQKNPYLAGQSIGTNRNYAYAASVNTFDAAGPASIQTIGNARVHQAQMDASIRRLQTAAQDGSNGTNTEVEQLNLMTAASVQSLEMQQTQNNAMVSLLEQQMIANKVQRDALADHMNFNNQIDQYTASESAAWGNAAQVFSTH